MSDDFDTFWSAYPRKMSKGEARKAWLQTAKIRPPLTDLLAAIAAAKKCEQWHKNRGEFIPYPASWLRAEGWEDEHEVILEDPKQWYETSTGIEAKGRELGINKDEYQHFPAFKSAVMAAANGKVVDINNVKRTDAQRIR